MGRRLLGIGLALGLALVIALWLLLRSLDALVAGQIEQIGSRLTGTRVSVGGVEIDLTAGSGTIRGLAVANPEGFPRDDAFRLASITLAIDLTSLGAQPLELSRLEVGEVEVRFDLDARGRSNLDALQRHVQAQSGEAEGEATGESGEPLRIRIAKLRMAGGQITTEGPHTGGEVRSAPFPGLALDDVGGARGASAGAVARQVLLAFTERVIGAAASNSLRGALEKGLGGAAGDAGKAVDGLLRRLRD